MLLGEATVEGRYTLKIRDKDTGEIKDEFSFSNFVTDQVFYKRQDYLSVANACYAIESIPKANITEPIVVVNDINDTGITKIRQNDVNRDLYLADTKVMVSDATKSKIISSRVIDDVINRVDRKVFNYAKSFVFNSGNTIDIKSIVIVGGYENWNNKWVYNDPENVFSFATIKRNGVPYTLQIGVNDILEVYYQFLMYDDISTYPKTLTKEINNVNTTITLEKTGYRIFSNVRLNNMLINNITINGTVDGSTVERILSPPPNFIGSSKVLSGGDIVANLRYYCLDGSIPSNSNITNIMFESGLNTYRISFNPPIRKSEYQQWTFEFGFKYTRKVSA